MLHHTPSTTATAKTYCSQHLTKCAADKGHMRQREAVHGTHHSPAQPRTARYKEAHLRSPLLRSACSATTSSSSCRAPDTCCLSHSASAALRLYPCPTLVMLCVSSGPPPPPPPPPGPCRMLAPPGERAKLRRQGVVLLAAPAAPLPLRTVTGMLARVSLAPCCPDDDVWCWWCGPACCCAAASCCCSCCACRALRPRSSCASTACCAGVSAPTTIFDSTLRRASRRPRCSVSVCTCGAGRHAGRQAACQLLSSVKSCQLAETTTGSHRLACPCTTHVAPARRRSRQGKPHQPPASQHPKHSSGHSKRTTFPKYNPSPAPHLQRHLRLPAQQVPLHGADAAPHR